MWPGKCRTWPRGAGAAPMCCGEEALSEHRLTQCSPVASSALVTHLPSQFLYLKFGKQGRRWLKGKTLWGNEINPRGFPAIRVFQGTVTSSRGRSTVTPGSQGSRDAGVMFHAPLEPTAALPGAWARSWHCFSSACSLSSQGTCCLLMHVDFLPSLHTCVLITARYMQFIQLDT